MRLFWKPGKPRAGDPSGAGGGEVHANVAAFLTDLVLVAPSAGGGNYSFKSADGRGLGFVQLICFQRTVKIHRIWATEPGKGGGSVMMRALCDLADRHGVEMKLKVIPIGRKPYPMSRQQLKAWYQRRGFTGLRWHLTRQAANDAKPCPKAWPTGVLTAC
jgi:hypothetical protein